MTCRLFPADILPTSPNNTAISTHTFNIVGDRIAFGSTPYEQDANTIMYSNATKLPGTP
jgi:hypothetical protein